MAFDDDEFGSADDLDALPSEAYRELETQALASTQHRRASNPNAHANQAPPPSAYDFPDADTIELDGQPLVAGPPKNAAAGPPRRFGGNSVAPARNHATTRRTTQDLAGTQREPFYEDRLSRHARNSNYNHGGIAASSAAQPRPDAGGDELRGYVEKLENQILLLARAKVEADATAQKKSGEASIIREKANKAERDHKDELASIQKSFDEKTAALEAKLKAARGKLDRVESEKMFLEHDFKSDAGKAKTRRNLKNGTANGNAENAQASTPRKNRIAEHGDGFDNDGDQMMQSPSKSRNRSKNGTPRQGSKRKRNAVETSPSKPLPLAEPQQAQVPEDEMIVMPDAEVEVEVLEDARKDDGKFKLLKRLMNHRPAGSRVRTFEALTEYALPSLPERLLSSVIYDGISLYRNESSDFPTHFCRILLSLWDRCAQESYYPPLHLIIETLQFVLSFEPLEKTASLAQEIAPLAQSSATLVVWTSLDNPELKRHIDLHECLCLILTLSRSCAHDAEAATRLWSLISRDFIRALLKSPLLSTRSLTVQLLATSITPSTFGPIPDFDPADLPTGRVTPNKPVTLLDHLTSLLQDNPYMVSSGPAPWSFRLTLLHTFSSFLPSPAAAAALATHKLFLGRLFILLNDALASLYATAPRTPLATILGRIVNLATRIAYNLIREPATRPLVDRHARLAAAPGAGHAHLVALTRVAFVDLDVDDEGDGEYGGGRVLEAGIEEEVVDMAHAMLDEFLSPEEGEELLKVFSTARTNG